VTFFGDIMVMTSLNDVITIFFRFRHNQLQKSLFGQITNFRSPILRGTERGKPPAPLIIGDLKFEIVEIL